MSKISQVFKLKDEIDYKENSIEMKTIEGVKLLGTLMAFDKGKEIPTHTAKGCAFITCLDGKGEITIRDEKFILSQGDSIIIEALAPHSVKALEKYKMLLIVG